MWRALSCITSLCLAAMLASPASPSAAYAASYLDEAVQALQSENVYVSAQTREVDKATEERLEQMAGDNDIAIVVLPQAAASEAAGGISQFVSSVAARTDHDTIVVAIGNDLEAGSRSLQPGLAGSIANRAEANNATVSDALLDFVTEVSESPPVGDAGDSSNVSDGVFGTVTIVLIIVVVLAMIGAATVGFVARRRRADTSAQSHAPQSIQELLAEIRGYIPQIKDRRVIENLANGEHHTQQLFMRLERTGSNQIQEVTAKYTGLLQVVRNILHRYVDIQDHPEYYMPNTRQYLTDGQDATAQYTAGVLQNVREVESGNLTDFRVDVKMLAASNPSDDPRL